MFYCIQLQLYRQSGKQTYIKDKERNRQTDKQRQSHYFLKFVYYYYYQWRSQRGDMEECPPPSRTSGKLCMHVFTFNLGPMSGPLTGKARSLTQLQAVIRVRLVREPSGEAGSE